MPVTISPERRHPHLDQTHIAYGQREVPAAQPLGWNVQGRRPPPVDDRPKLSYPPALLDPTQCFGWGGVAGDAHAAQPKCRAARLTQGRATHARARDSRKAARLT